MSLIKAFGKTLIAIIIVALLCVTCWLFGYLKDNIWVNYFFPYFAYHVFAALFFYIVVSAYFSESSKDVISTIIGLCLAGFMAYREYLQFVAAGAGQSLVASATISAPDNALKIVYGLGLLIGTIKTVLDLYGRFRSNFSNNPSNSAIHEKPQTRRMVNKPIEKVEEVKENQETVNNELPKEDHTS